MNIITGSRKGVTKQCGAEEWGSTYLPSSTKHKDVAVRINVDGRQTTTHCYDRLEVI